MTLKKPDTKQSLESGVTLKKPATKQSLECGVTLKKPATKFGEWGDSKEACYKVWSVG